VSRPSEPILEMLRGWVRRKGLTTAQVAERSGLERARVKVLLAGQDVMTIDEFLLVTQAMDIGPEELGLVPSPDAPASPDATVAERPTRPTAPRLVIASGDTPPPPIPLRPVQTVPTPTGDAPLEPDALGNLPKQVLQLGFALGIDLFMILDARQLRGSNVPQAVLSRFPETLPIRLEARYHSHNRPRYLDDCFECVLSFDALYTCTFPWSAFREVRFLLPEEAPRPSVPPERTDPEPPTSGGPRLRVVK
jgi:hypothetical protein